MTSRWHAHPSVRSGLALTRGERAADRMRNGMGSWAFIGLFILMMAAWAVVNSVFWLFGAHGKHGFDPYPYILLNLFLSMVAGLQGAILLIAAKRADAISSELALHDDQLLTENTALTREVHAGVQATLANTEMLHELMARTERKPAVKKPPATRAGK
jgi:uncharacterized membrane protein